MLLRIAVAAVLASLLLAFGIPARAQPHTGPVASQTEGI